MRSATFLAASSLLAAIHAAPRAMPFGSPNVDRDRFGQDVDARPELAVRHHEMGMEQAPVDPDCPADKLIVSTTTIDVTVYVTAAANTTTPCPEEAITVVTIDSTTTECPEDQMTPIPRPPPTSTLLLNPTKHITQVVKVSTPVVVNSTLTSVAVQTPLTKTHVFNLTYTTPRPEDETTLTPTSIETEPCPEETPTAEHLAEETSVVKISVIPTTTLAPQSTICIDTSMTPVSSSKFSISGTPKPDSAYIHGKPAGTCFIAEFIEDKPGIPVSEEGCYQFCDSVMESTTGCKSFRYYKNQLGAPRCALYGMPISDSVDDLDKSQPDTWYDLACGSPKEQKWHAGRQGHAQQPQLESLA